tara:strand:+ start:155 stop:907 length:753 start_codon:yes stop_codon:yes gene_type:complete
MHNKQKYKTLLNTALCGGSLFFILSLLGMYFYPGGTMWHNSSNEGVIITKYYSHTLNFFSDLGSLQAWSGNHNIISNFFFVASLFSVAIAIVSLYYAFHYILKKDKKLILLSKIGIFISIISAIGFVGVGFTPSDTLHEEHMFFVNLAFRSFLIVMFIYSYAIFKSSYLKNYLALIYFLLFCLVLYYTFILVMFPLIDSNDFANGIRLPRSIDDLKFHVVSQKFVVYGLSFSILWQLFQLKKQKYIDLID